MEFWYSRKMLLYLVLSAEVLAKAIWESRSRNISIWGNRNRARMKKMLTMHQPRSHYLFSRHSGSFWTVVAKFLHWCYSLCKILRRNLLHVYLVSFNLFFASPETISIYYDQYKLWEWVWLAFRKPERKVFKSQDSSRFPMWLSKCY